MDFNTLKIFYKVAELKQVTAAAEYLGRSQSSISERLKKLEESLDTRLYKSTKDGITLTVSGEMLFERAKKIIADFEIIKHDIKGLNKERSHVKISTTHPFISHFIVNTLPLMAEEYPNLTIEMVYNDSPLDLILGEADINIRPYENEEKKPEIEQLPLTKVQMQLFASKEYLERNGTPNKNTDLVNHIMIASAHDMIDPTNPPWPFSMAKKHKRPIFQFSPAHSIQQAVEFGMGIAALSEEMVKMNKSNVVHVLTSEKHDIDMRYCCLKKIKNDPHIVFLYNAFKKHLEEINNASDVNSF